MLVLRKWREPKGISCAKKTPVCPIGKIYKTVMKPTMLDIRKSWIFFNISSYFTYKNV